MWQQKIPQLTTYARKWTLTSVQNSVLSRRNCPAGFDDIVSAIRDGWEFTAEQE